MCKLAYEAMNKQVIHMNSEFIKKHVKIVLKNNDTAQVSYESVLEYLSSTHLIRSLDNGVKDKKKHTYFFVHQSFQEYFAAYYIKQMCFKNDEVPKDIITCIKENCDKRYFLLTWRFACGILYNKQEEGEECERSKIVNLFLHQLFGATFSTEIESLILMIHCLDECPFDQFKYKILSLDTYRKQQHDFLNNFIFGQLEFVNSFEFNVLSVDGKQLCTHIQLFEILRCPSTHEHSLKLIQDNFKHKTENVACMMSVLCYYTKVDINIVVKLLRDRSIHEEFQRGITFGHFQQDITAEEKKEMMAMFKDKKVDDSVRSFLEYIIIRKNLLHQKK
ncbi:hypothetical protein AKO1_008075 [Acrasis kona]|uniref:Uncharacterized protein n=1 Tax=Acrasis kona TaxID=1008807 RepID=A0AAW2YP62_9EUKA